MRRINYTIVEAQVDQMYDFSITDAAAIDQRCDEIRNFIEACGWNIDDYIRRMMGYQDIECN